MREQLSKVRIVTAANVNVSFRQGVGRFGSREEASDFFAVFHHEGEDFGERGGG
jgi:hypothetical protein